MKIRFSAFVLIFGVALTPSPFAMGRTEGAIQKSWDYPEGIRTLVVEADRQDVVLKAGGPRLTGRLVGDSADVVKTVRGGDSLTITVKTDKSWFTWQKKSSRIEISLPPGLDLDVTTASGAVLVQVETQSLRVRSASGDIEAPRGGGSVDVDSTSGTVRLKGFTGPVKASAISGELLLEDLSGEIRATTMSGDLKGTGLAPTNKSRFTTVSGKVGLTLVGGPEGYAVQAETASGDIKIGTASADHALSMGTGPRLEVKSVSGDIRVQ